MTLETIEKPETIIDPEPMKAYEASEKRLRHDLLFSALLRGLFEVRTAFSCSPDAARCYGGLN